MYGLKYDCWSEFKNSAHNLAEQTPGQDHLSDLFVLDPATATWAAVPMDNAPPGRAEMGLAASPTGDIYVFGGGKYPWTGNCLSDSTVETQNSLQNCTQKIL
jgi:hypothetical protein